MNEKWIGVVLIACFCSGSLIASERGDSYTLDSNENKVVYEDRVNGAWGRLSFIPKGGKAFSLYSTANSGSLIFEESTQQDFSPDRTYLMVNKIENATVSSGIGKDESVEKYYCSFLDMHSGCIVRENTGEFCGGAWGPSDGEWITGVSSNFIDPRQDTSVSQKDHENYFRAFLDQDNFLRCLPR